MADEFTPELNQSVLDAMLRRIREDEGRRVAAARGESTARGLSGGRFEASRVGAAERIGAENAADAAIRVSFENAARQREERLIKEGREYQTSERLGSEAFSSKENLAARLFGREERLGSEAFQGKERLADRLFG